MICLLLMFATVDYDGLKLEPHEVEIIKLTNE